MAQYLIGSGLPRLTAKKLVCQGMELRVADLGSGLSRLHSLLKKGKHGCSCFPCRSQGSLLNTLLQALRCQVAKARLDARACCKSKPRTPLKGQHASVSNRCTAGSILGAAHHQIGKQGATTLVSSLSTKTSCKVPIGSCLYDSNEPCCIPLTALG